MQTSLTSPATHRSALQNALQGILMGSVLFLALLVVLVAGFQLVYMGRIFPGVSMSGLDLGGLTTVEAAEKISANVSFPLSGNIIIQYGDRNWHANPAELGLFMDLQGSAENAFRLGRSGSLAQRLAEQVGALYYQRSASLDLIQDERITYGFINKIAMDIDDPAREATITVQGTDVIVTDGHVGRKVDIYATLESVTNQLRSFQDGIISLQVNEIRPLVLDAGSQAEQARIILSQPLNLLIPEGQNVDSDLLVVPPTVLAQMLKFELVSNSDGANYHVAIDQEKMRAYLSQLISPLELLPQNTRFIFNDETRRLEILEPAVIGRSLDIEKSAAIISEQLPDGIHAIPLQFIFTNPPVKDEMTGEQLGITELIHEEVSYFRGSSTDRVQNIKTAARSFHGLLVSPGQTFSMASALGDISLDNGYAEALIILGNQTIKGVGGGVCQVSTTLFRTAFFAGFPILERHAHAYRVGYYEQTAVGHSANLSGLDATVFVPIVDLKFTNDSPYWLLMETYVNPTYGTIIWKFYSTSDGRSVDWSTTGPENIVEAPEDLYRENPDLAQDEIKQIEWKADGADVTIRRTVTKKGQIHFQDSFSTHYLPWQAVYEYGPGTEIPPPEPE